MKECDISSKHPRKKHGSYKKFKEELIKDNLFMQNLSADTKNETWVGDITYIPTKKGFNLYSL